MNIILFYLNVVH